MSVLLDSTIRVPAVTSLPRSPPQVLYSLSVCPIRLEHVCEGRQDMGILGA